jgi:hypothetical protein
MSVFNGSILFTKTVLQNAISVYYTPSSEPYSIYWVYWFQQEGLVALTANRAVKILQNLFGDGIIYRNTQSPKTSVTWTRNDRGLLKLEFCLSEQGKSTHNLKVFGPYSNLKPQGWEWMVLVTNKSIAAVGAKFLRNDGYGSAYLMMSLSINTERRADAATSPPPVSCR